MVFFRRHSDLFVEDATPRARVDVLDRLGEGPVMACEIFCRVLPFAVWVVGRWIENTYAQARGACMMVIDVGDTHHDGISGSQTVPLTGYDQGTVSEGKLSTMIADS